jgi:hypothetical protein
MPFGSVPPAAATSGRVTWGRLEFTSREHGFLAARMWAERFAGTAYELDALAAGDVPDEVRRAVEPGVVDGWATWRDPSTLEADLPSHARPSSPRPPRNSSSASGGTAGAERVYRGQAAPTWAATPTPCWAPAVLTSLAAGCPLPKERRRSSLAAEANRRLPRSSDLAVAQLRAKQRKKPPRSAFAYPSRRVYPIDTKAMSEKYSVAVACSTASCASASPSEIWPCRVRSRRAAPVPSSPRETPRYWCGYRGRRDAPLLQGSAPGGPGV